MSTLHFDFSLEGLTSNVLVRFASTVRIGTMVWLPARVTAAARHAVMVSHPIHSEFVSPPALKCSVLALGAKPSFHQGLEGHGFVRF